MSSSSTIPPPDGYASWLDYAVETLDTRSVQLQTMFDNDKPWIPREDMRAAAHKELLALQHAAGTPGSALLKRWKLPLSQRTGRSEDAIVEDALLATDFPASSVHIVFEDGSELSFRRAFYLGEVEKRKVDRTICRVAVFTEHCGYHEFWIGPDDRIGHN